MHTVPVAILLVLIVALVVVVAYITTVVVIVVAVLVALLIVGRPLFAAYPGAVPLLVVRTTVVVLFAAAFAIFAAFLTGRTVPFIGRVLSRLVGFRRG